jgi:hypothetical protein
MLELIGLGAFGSAEDTPPSLASSPSGASLLLVKASGFSTAYSPLDTSTSMQVSWYIPWVLQTEEIHQQLK